MPAPKAPPSRPSNGKPRGKGVVNDLVVTPTGKKPDPIPTRTATPPHPRLVNRGPAGLLHKKKSTGGELNEEKVGEKAAKTVAKARYRIAPELQHMAVAVDSLSPDPMNARLHPERNMDAIKESLETYGQVKPLVVRKETSVVIAGNGTLAAAKALGWDEVAVHWVDMNEAEAAGYGLADNRSAELAKWDLEVVAALDKMLLEQGQPSIGWSADELEVLRAADWVPPVQTEEEFAAGAGLVSIKMTPEEMELVGVAVAMVREQLGDKKLTDGACLKVIADEWMFPEHREERLTDAETEAPEA